MPPLQVLNLINALFYLVLAGLLVRGIIKNRSSRLVKTHGDKDTLFYNTWLPLMLWSAVALGMAIVATTDPGSALFVGFVTNICAWSTYFISNRATIRLYASGR